MFDRVLIAVDGSKQSLNAISVAHGRGILNGAEVRILTAFDSGAVTLHGLLKLTRERMEALHDAVRERCLEPARELLGSLKVEVDEALMIEASPVDAIAAQAERWGADLVVAGRRGLGAIQSLFIGSVSRRLLQRCPCPVLVVPNDASPEPPTPRRFVAATDLSEAAEVGLELAAQLAKHCEAELLLVHCVSAFEIFPVGTTPHSRYMIEELQHIADTAGFALGKRVERLAADGISARSHVVREEAARGLLETAKREHAGLLVIASHGRGGVEKLWLGSTAAVVVRKASQPVLVVRRS